MKKQAVIVAVLMAAVLSLATTGRAQTSNNKYEVTLFGTLPPGEKVWNLPRSVTADGKGTIYLLRASDPPVLVYNREGKLLNMWGSGLFKEAHSIDLDRQGHLWISDRADNMVYEFTTDGKMLMSLGKKGVGGNDESTDLFNGASDVAIAPNGDIFVSDGQGKNNRIVKFSKAGKFIKYWGGKGSAPGQFETPHALAFDSKGRLLVVDEQTKNHPRIQIFDQNGSFIEQWDKLPLIRPTGIAIATDDTVYIGDSDANAIFVVKDGKLLDTIGDLQARPHNIALDPSTGVLYLADPITPLHADSGPILAGTDPNRAPGGIFKQVIPKASSACK
jgi:DNA-binding beta-propeller fold protein YncE